MKISRKKLKQIIKEEIFNEMYGIEYDRKLVNKTIVDINHKLGNKIGDKVWNAINKIAKDTETMFGRYEIAISVYGKKLTSRKEKDREKMIAVSRAFRAFRSAEIIELRNSHFGLFSLTEKGSEPSPEDMVDKELSFIGVKDY
tara:strand:+ start:39 stop:467 length:429 start_codon:yes stop_codon:yes gene_type:complete